MNPERFVVGLTPSPTAARVSRQRSSLRLQIIFAAIFGAVLLMIWLGPQLLPGGVGQAMQNILPAWGLPAIAAFWALATLVRIGVTVFFSVVQTGPGVAGPRYCVLHRPGGDGVRPATTGACPLG